MRLKKKKEESLNKGIANGRIALTAGSILTILDENDRCNHSWRIFSYPFRGSKSKVDCIATSEVWTTGMLVTVEPLHQISCHNLATQSLGPPYLTEAL